MDRVLSLRRHRAFIGNIAAMMTGKALASFIALATMPVVARLFSPSDFGVAASYLSIIGIVSNVAALRYEHALVLPKEDGEAVVLMALAYRILLAACLLMLLVIAAYDLAGFHWEILEVLGPWRWLLPLGVLLMAGLQIQESWLAREVAFRLVAASTVVGTIINSAVRIGAGLLWGTSSLALICSNLVGMFGRILIQRSASVQGFKAAFGRFDYAALREAATRYSDFPRLDAPSGLVFALGQNLPVLFFGTMFSPASAGLYAMANRLSQAPMTIVASSTRRVFLQKAAAIRNQGRSLRRAFLMTTGALVLLGAAPFVVIWLFGQPLLGWLLGQRWLEAGRYLEIMAPWLLMVWVTAPCNPVFVVHRRQNVWLVLQTTLTVLRLGAFGLAYALGATAEWALQAFVIATVAGNLVTIAIALILTSAEPPAQHDVPLPAD